ncbi:MAG: riboflavin biosynthesis protein RibF [Lentisphaeria bacterium]|nr:riboflavin biosynthesis protein RibF [Lentisphaeria bacterium]
MCPEALHIASSLDGLNGRIALAIGAFDGVHLGHRAVLSTLLAQAERYSARPVALFFDPIPKHFFKPENQAMLLTTMEEKIRLLQSLGISEIVRMPFDRDLATLRPEAFASTYLFGNKNITLCSICVGEDWRFGHDNTGDVTLLTELSAQHSCEVVPVPGVLHGDTWISSSRIRRAIAEGDFNEANAMLGRKYTIDGEVIHGNEIATNSLKCPTANLLGQNLQLPPFGVYAARTRIEQSPPVDGIVYIGDAPTFRTDGNPIVELHLFNFNDSIYGKRISVEPVAFLRESRVFADSEALTAQIQLDIANAKRLLEETR